jgi:HEAT repeat protein
LTPAPLDADPVRDADARVRSQAAWALGMIGDPAATDALIDALEDEDVQDQAMWALSQVMRTGGLSGVDRSDLADRLRRALRRDPVLEM